MATMETLHRLAGVQDASDLGASSNERPSYPQVLPDPPPIPDDDTYNSSARAASRSSLPLNRRPSHRSFASSKNNRSRSQSRVGEGSHSRAPDLNDYPPTPHLPDGTFRLGTASAGRRSHDTVGSVATTGTEDFAWGPNHPCFPHPNPHCSPDSEEYANTRVIRVRRDWLQSGDLYPQFANLYPEILDPLVGDTDFRFLISNVNARLKAACDPYTTRAWVDSLMGALTGYLWDDFGLAGIKKDVKGLERFVSDWNRQKVSEGKDVRLVQLRKTGFLSLEFIVPDPGIDAIGGEGSEGDEQEGQSDYRGA